MCFFQTGDVAGTGETRPDRQSDEELSGCLEGTHWSMLSSLSFEMQIESVKQVLSATFKL